ncbi:MAG: PDR/VanB family oxidoreductase [Candidatus Nanopelagicales bacterium]
MEAEIPQFSVTVAGRRELACGHVAELRLAAINDKPLPTWSPGAHVDLVLPSGLVRQYSLCGDPADLSYTVAVLREPASRGGSAEVHERVQPGDTLMIRGPRNHFPLVPADHYVFIAGGIGITPLLAMVRSVAGSGETWELHYGGRSRSAMAYLDDIASLTGGEVAVYAQDEVGLIPVKKILEAAPRSSAVYTCGPEPLLVAVEQEGEAAALPVHLERFGPSSAPVRANTDDSEFTVTLQRSARTLPVPPGTRLIDVVRQVLPMVPFSCEEGYCGSCESVVLEGVPDHRDSVLSEAERESNTCMMICVGRSKTPQLVLDL